MRFPFVYRVVDYAVVLETRHFRFRAEKMWSIMLVLEFPFEKLPVSTGLLLTQ